MAHQVVALALISIAAFAAVVSAGLSPSGSPSSSPAAGPLRSSFPVPSAAPRLSPTGAPTPRAAPVPLSTIAAGPAFAPAGSPEVEPSSPPYSTEVDISPIGAATPSLPPSADAPKPNNEVPSDTPAESGAGSLKVSAAVGTIGVVGLLFF